MAEKKIIIAAKCAPQDEYLDRIAQAGIEAVELFLRNDMLDDVDGILKLCRRFPFQYALHAPGDGYNPQGVKCLARGLQAKIIVFHNIYWDDEWEEIAGVFRGSDIKVCIENTYCVHEPLKFMRRFGFGRCLDLEHLQMEAIGVYEEEFIPIMRQASHIHMTGYTAGSDLWHTHIHQTPEHNLRLLKVLSLSGYCGLVVSEAKKSLQTKKDFQELKDFINRWEKESVNGYLSEN